MMNSLGNNRYQLLFIDDEATEVSGRTKLMQQTGGQQKVLAKKPSQAKLGGRSDSGTKQPLRGNKIEAKKIYTPQLQQPQRNNRERPIQERIVQQSSEYAPREGFAAGGLLVKGKLDRRSSSSKTGIKAVVKRNGGGAHNWGSAMKDIEERNMGLKSAAPSERGDSVCEQPLRHDHQQQQADDDINYMTVEEWQALHGERAKPIYNLRKAGEGELEKPDWKQMTVLQQKKKPSKSETELGLEYDAAMYPQRVGRLQRIMDIDFRFKDEGRRNRCSARPLAKSEGCSINDPINMKDQIAFPTLGHCPRA